MKNEVTVKHVSVEIDNNFDEFTFRLEKALGVLEPAVLNALGAAPASMTRYLVDTCSETDLVLFNIISDQKIKKYQVGNPKIICRMTSLDPVTAFYFPLQLFVYEKRGGKVMVEYDLPSSLFERFKNPEIIADAKVLENSLIKLIQTTDKKNLL